MLSRWKKVVGTTSPFGSFCCHFMTLPEVENYISFSFWRHFRSPWCPSVNITSRPVQCQRLHFKRSHRQPRNYGHNSLASPPGTFMASQGRETESLRPGLIMCAQGPQFLHVCALEWCPHEMHTESPEGTFLVEP